MVLFELEVLRLSLTKKPVITCGSNFAVLAARLLAPPLDWCQPLELVRNPEEAKWLEELSNDISEEVRNKNLDPTEMVAIEKLKQIVRSEATDHRSSCDNRGASATELFAALLRGNRKVTVIGKKSAGSGCGYYSGGNPIHLKYSGLVIEVPNCTRRNHLGQNEISGVIPDLYLDIDLNEASARSSLLNAVSRLSR